MKFYTDPGYFFDLWQKQMAAGTEVQKKKNAKVKRVRAKIKKIFTLILN